METNLLDRMLAIYLEQRLPVTIVLQNRVRISGTIKAYDSYVIVLENQKSEIVYRHAVSSIAPASAARPAQPSTQRSEQPKAATRTERSAVQQAARKKGSKQQAASPTSDVSINTGMKEGLLRWMQERKASK